MTLDDETIEALGFGDHWEQLALRFPPFVVARMDAWQMRQRRAREAAYRRADGVPERSNGGRFERVYATEAERVEARRKSKREHMQRVRSVQGAA